LALKEGAKKKRVRFLFSADSDGSEHTDKNDNVAFCTASIKMGFNRETIKTELLVFL
jgi:hypothetical protein